MSFFAFLSVLLVPSAFAQYQTYPIYTNVTSVPAGSYGATIGASVDDSSATANFNVCFDTGYGSSGVPIVPYNYVNYGNFAEFNFDVPASTIQSVPPSVFANGSFNVSIYSVPTSFTGCRGNEAGAPQGNTLTLNYPVLNSVSLPDLPEQNASLASREPSSLSLNGGNFISNSGTTGKVPSAVSFVSSTNVAGTVRFLNSDTLRSTIPTTIPAGAASVNIEVCNNATYSYCSSPVTLKTAALKTNAGTLTASPSPALPTQPVTLTARFGPATHSTAGAPSGSVTFSDGGATLGAVSLVLDKTATFVRAPTQPFLTYAQPIAPIVADFNGDGIPDTLFIDPGNGSFGASLHLLLGTVPSGSFQADHQFYIFSDGPSFTISSAAVGDVNGDGILDIVLLATETYYSTNPTLFTMLGKGDGTFLDGFSASPTLYGSQIVAGDFNRDGKQDIVIAGALDANGTIGLETLIGDGTGSFTAGPATTGLQTAPSPYFGDFKVAAADFNADGYPDLVVMNGYSPAAQLDESIEVYQNNGTGAFLAPVRVLTDGTPTANFSIAALGPGLPLDIIVTSTASSIPGVYVALNQSTTDKIAFFSTFEGTQIPGFTQAVVGDFDGDGLLDVAVDDGKTIHVLSGNGYGAFTANYTDLSIVPPGTTLIAATDENGDKYADLLLYTSGPQNGNNEYPNTLYDYVTSGTATATLPPATFAGGSHALSASTDGTFDILAGTAATTLDVTKITPSIVLTSFPDSPQTYAGSTTTLIGSLFDNSQNPAAGSTATGTASFYNGTTLVGTAPVVRTDDGAGDVNDAATLRLVNLAVGTYSFTVSYPGDANHAAATSSPVAFQVTAGTPNISWQPNPATISYGTPLSSDQLNAVATGVTGETVSGSFSYAPAAGTILNVGSNPVVVTFTPTDPNYATTTATQNIVVTQVRPTVTFTITSGGRDTSSVASGSVVTLTAKVNVAGKAVNPGQVNFCDATAAYCTDIHLLGTAQLTSAGTATLRFVPGIGSHNYQAVFLGTSNDAGSLSEPAALTVTGIYPTSTTIAQSGSVGNYTLTATTVGTGTLGVAPTGTVSFLDSSNESAVLGTGMLGAGTKSVGFATSTVPTTTSGKTTSYGIAAGDLNGDGKPDLVVPNYSTGNDAGNLSVYLSNGDGTFTAAPSIAVPRAESSAIADLNNDGIPDIIAAGQSESGTVSILLGKGDGTFTEAANPPQGLIAGLAAPVVGDFNEDGNTDFMLTDYTTGDSFTVYLGHGDGTFTALKGPTPNNQDDTFEQVVTGDFNSDGKLDFAIATDGAVLIFLGNGDGTFLQVADVPTGVIGSGGMAVGDLNADGVSDIVLTGLAGSGNTSPSLVVLLGNGDGTFAAATSITEGEDDPISIADLNGDGIPDVIDYGSNQYTILLGKGDGTFAATSGPISGGNVGVTICAADFNGDGRPDIAAVNSTTGGAEILLTQLTQTSVATATAISPLGGGTHQVVASYPGDANYAQSVSTPTGLMGTTIAPVINWIPTPATISYGTALAASQLDATATTATGGTIAGVFTYTHTAGAILTAGTQILNVVFTPTSSIYSVATAQATITVTQAAPVVTWLPNPATITYGTALSAAQLDAAATAFASSVSGTFVYTPALGTVLPAGPQTLKVSFTPTDAVDFLPATGTAQITVTGGIPVITWVPSPASISYGTALSAAQLDASSSTPGTFTYTPALGTVLPAGTQTLSVLFTPIDTVHYKSVTTTVPITITQAIPGVTWSPNPNVIAYGTALSAAQLDANSATVGTFTYTPALGSVLSAGTQILTAVFTPRDATDFKSVTITTTITVTAATPTVTWTPNPATIAYGTALTAAQLDATSNIPGTFTYTPGLGTALSTGIKTLSAVFSPTDTTDFKSVTTTVNITVIPATPAVVWTPNPATISYGTGLTAAQLNATANTPGIFTYSPGLGAVLSAGAQTLTATFTPTDTTDFKPVTATTSINVTAAIPAVTWTPNPASIAYGTALSAAQLDATATTAGTFAYTPALGAVLGAGTQTLTSVFTPTDTTDFKPVTSRVTIVVAAVAPSIAWTPNPAAISYGTALSAAQLDATASTAGTFAYTPALGTLLSAGPQTLKVTFTPTDGTDFTPAIATTTITVTAAAPTITWTPNPATITFGTALTAAQLDATAATTGTFAYTPALGTVLTAGTHTLSATFTPNDTADFKSATATASITVSAATPAIAWLPNPATITYGTGLSAAQLNATASTPGTFSYTPAIGTILTAGTQTLSVTFTPNDTADFKSVTATATIIVTAATPAIAWTPNPASIAYGTGLSGAQLDATSSTPGTFNYNPALGTVLPAGTQILSVFFTPTDTKDFKSVSASALITVAQTAPTLSWATPASIVVGSALSSMQLDAVATGAAGATLPGTFTYTPAAGTVLSAGSQTLKVTFIPTDLADYTSATASVTLQVIPVTLTALSTTNAMLGDPAKTITLTGTGFVPTASVLVNGSAVSTTFVNATTLTAIIPAADFVAVQVLEISVSEPSQNQSTAALPFLVGAPPADAVFTGPSTLPPASQTGLTFQLPAPYPVDLAAHFQLSFTPAAGLPNDPTVVFATGGTSFDAVIPANTTAVPSVQIQGGTVAGSVTVGLTLTAGGVNVTPASIQPLSIQTPLAAPGITSATFAANGSTLTVTVRGFSNPRDMTSAKFHFTPVSGGSISTPDVTIDVGSLFTTWYADPASSQYGSGFTYTQVFNLSSDASVVGQVSVTLTNSAGVSQEASTP